jgi:hypothetical protein
MRAISGNAAVRFGICGSLSAINSPTAPSEKRTTAKVDPIKPKEDAESFNHPSFAAHATTAGAVIDRKPETTPIPNANRNT